MHAMAHGPFNDSLLIFSLTPWGTVAPAAEPEPSPPYFFPKRMSYSLSYPASIPTPTTARKMFAPASLNSDLVPFSSTIYLNASIELLYFTVSPEVIIILLRTVSAYEVKVCSIEVFNHPDKLRPLLVIHLCTLCEGICVFLNLLQH